jgi:hypothetical protein
MRDRGRNSICAQLSDLVVPSVQLEMAVLYWAATLRYWPSARYLKTTPPAAEEEEFRLWVMRSWMFATAPCFEATVLLGMAAECMLADLRRGLVMLRTVLPCF